MPIRNWGGGGDHSDTFVSLQDQLVAIVREQEERAKAERAARSRRSGGGGGRSGGRGGSTQGVHEGAGVIIEGMSRGSTNWRNLYAYYNKKLSQLPKSSPIYNQVQRQVQNIEMVAQANGINLAGGVAPGDVSAAEPGTNRYDEDAFLSPEVDAAINDQILFLMATRNGIYPNTDRPLASFANRMLYDGTVRELRTGMIADARIQEEILQDIKSGATFITDPVSGNVIEITPEFTLNLIYQYNENQLALAGIDRGLGQQGDFAGRIATWEGVQESLIAPIISEQVFPAVDENGRATNPDVDGISGYMDQSLLQFNVLKNMALQSSDPSDLLRNLTAAGKSLRRSMRDLEKFLGGMPEGFEVEDYIREDLAFSVQLADYLVNVEQMTPEDAMAQGAALLESHPGENYFLSRSEITSIIGGWSDEVGSVGEAGSAVEGRISPGWSGVAGSLAAIDGINVNTAARNLQEVAVGAEQYVWVSPYGQSTPVAVPASGAAAYLQALSGNDLFAGGLSQGAFPSIEKVRSANGRMITTVVWREMRPPDNEAIEWWTKENRDGEQIWATMQDFQKFGGDRIMAAREGWQLAPFAGLENFYTVVGADGQTYYIRNDTKQAYVNQPIDLPLGAEFHPTDLLDEEGRVLPEYGHVKFNGNLTLVGPGVDYITARQIAANAFTAGELSFDDYGWLNEFGVPLNKPTLDNVLASYTPPPSYFQGAYHEDRRRNYDATARSYYENARREQFRAREVQKEWLAAQDPNTMRKEGFEQRYENVVENSLQIAQRRTGIRFGADGSKRPNAFRQPTEMSIEQIAKPILEPVRIEALQQPQTPAYTPTVLPGVDDTPTITKPKTSTDTKKSSTTKPASSPGGGGGSKLY